MSAAEEHEAEYFEFMAATDHWASKTIESLKAQLAQERATLDIVRVNHANVESDLVMRCVRAESELSRLSSENEKLREANRNHNELMAKVRILTRERRVLRKTLETCHELAEMGLPSALHNIMDRAREALAATAPKEEK